MNRLTMMITAALALGVPGPLAFGGAAESHNPPVGGAASPHVSPADDSPDHGAPGHDSPAGSPAAAQNGFSDNEALAYSQAAIGRVPGDYRFRNARGGEVSLSSLRGKPLVISFIYTGCAHACPVITQSLARAVDVGREALGEDSFMVATIGFDVPADTSARMEQFAVKQGITDRRWLFLSADKETIDGLSRDLGFLFFPSSKGFDHLSQVTLLDAEGKVYRQVYDENFAVIALVEPLKQLVFGIKVDEASMESWISGLRLFCTVYDPASGRYRFNYSVIMALAAGLLSSGMFLAFLIHAWRGNRRFHSGGGKPGKSGRDEAR